MSLDVSKTAEAAHVGISSSRDDSIKWRCKSKVEKLWIPQGLRKADLADIEFLGRYSRIDGKTSGEKQAELLRAIGVEPEIIEIDGNLLMYGGASCQWQTLIGNGTVSAGANLTYFNNAQAAVGVGDSSTAAVATTNDLVAATNKLRVAMDATFPVHADGITSPAASIQFKSTFSTAQANWAWQEWGVFNSATAATGRMLQRKVESLGTKTSSSSWALTVTLSLA